MANQDFTERDKEYLHCLAQGLTDVQIAEKMKIARGTVQGSHRMRLAQLTGLLTKEAMVEYAMQHGYGEEKSDD